MPPYVRWIRRLFRPARSRPFASSPPRVEALEGRHLLTGYTVTTTLDLLNDTNTGEVTLRDVLTAISTQAPSGNAAAGQPSNTVTFAIGTAGTVQTIDLTAALPALTHQAFLDGWSQGGAGYHGPPLIVLNGAGAGNANGLELDAGSDRSVARGLVIQHFGKNGIEVKGSSGNLIAGNYLGTDAAGTSGLGNSNDGILLDAGATANTVGGTTQSAGNVISANGNTSTLAGNGVEITGAGTSGNVVLGNFIGTDATGTASLANVNDGVLVGSGARGNTIGGTAAAAANVIDGNLGVVPGQNDVSSHAVFSLGASRVSGSLLRFDIDVNYTDVAPLQMVYAGVDIRNSSGDLAPVNSGTGQQDFSAFSFTRSSNLGSGWEPVANAFPGEFLFHTPPASGGPPSGLLPNATYLVGTLTYDLSRFGITPSPSDFVSIMGTDTVIGTEKPSDPSTFNFITPGFAPAEQPLQAPAGGAGVEVAGAGTSGNVVLGNLIGTDKSGTVKLGPFNDGVLIHAGAAHNTVGGTAAGSANVLAGNNYGVAVSDSGTTGNAVLGNRVGTDRGGTIDLGNTTAGVFIENGAASNTVGGSVIAFNNAGVVVGSSPSDTGTVHDSILGNNIFGSARLGIDLGNTGQTTSGPNPRAFPNDGQNSPVITALTLHSVSGTLTSVPNTTFRVELFANPVGGAPNRAQIFLGAFNLPIGASGSAGFTVPIGTLPPGTFVTATATNLANGDTSAFTPGGTQILVLSGPTVTTVNGQQVVTMSVQIISQGKPLAAGAVKFTIAGLPGQATATAGPNGLFTVSYAVPPGTRPGRYTILATFPGDEDIPGAVTVGTVTLTPPSGRVARRWFR